MARAFRKLLGYLLPYWAADDEADGAFSFSLAALIDIDMQRARSGLEARFPSLAGKSGLALAGRDRLIYRGRDETDSHYAARLRRWRYPRGHRIRGNTFALLEQISEYFGGGFDLWGIDRSGNRREWSATGEESYSYGNAWTWDSTAAAYWARQWIVIDGSDVFREQPDFGDASLWGGALGETGYCVGIRDASYQDWRAIIRLTQGPHRWLPAGTQGEWIIVSMDGTDPVPDATWEDWSVSVDVGWLTFDGANDYVTMGNVAALGFDYNDSFTLSFWFKTSAAAAAQTLVGKRVSGGPGWLVNLSSAGDLRLLLIGATTTTQATYDAALNEGEWHHGAVVWKADGTGAAANASMYVDGVAVTVDPTSSALTETIVNASAVTVGALDGGTTPFNGAIARVAIWDSALTPAQAAALYAAGRHGDISALAPLGEWRMGDGDTYPTITDHGTGGNDGTMTNMAADDIVTVSERIASRDEDMRYIALRSELLDYTPDDTDWVNGFEDVEGHIMAGDDASFPATIILPDGTSYAGDNTNWPDTITLIDDGSKTK